MQKADLFGEGKVSYGYEYASVDRKVIYLTTTGTGGATSSCTDSSS